MAKSGAVARACSQSRSVPTGTRKRLANSDCDSPSPVLVLRIRRARWPRSSASAVTSKSSASVRSAGSVICFFFTLVAPSHRDKARQAAPPHENAGEPLLPNEPDHLEPLFAVDLADGGNDQVVVVLKNPIAKGQ